MAKKKREQAVPIRTLIDQAGQASADYNAAKKILDKLKPRIRQFVQQEEADVYPGDIYEVRASSYASTTVNVYAVAAELLGITREEIEDASGMGSDVMVDPEALLLLLSMVSISPGKLDDHFTGQEIEAGALRTTESTGRHTLRFVKRDD